MALNYMNLTREALADIILAETDKQLVFASDCNRELEASMRANKSLREKIPSFTGASVTTSDITDISKPTATEGKDSSIFLDINKVAKFNFKVGKLDKWLSRIDLNAKLIERAKYETANSIDSYLATLYTEAYKTISVNELTVDNVVDVLLKAREYLVQYANIPDQISPVITVSPAFMSIITKAKIASLTDNIEAWTNGFRGKFNNMTIKSSNNVYKDASGYEHIMCRTKDAIYFATLHTEIEGEIPSSTEFSGTTAGFTTYGAKVALPKELVHIEVKAYHDYLTPSI